MKTNLQVTFLGVRGTAPTPAADYLKYGGNTSCVLIQSTHGDSYIQLLCDAGTGIISHVASEVAKGTKVFHVLLSHMHYDHMIGLIKFAPLFKADCVIHLYGQPYREKSLEEIFSHFFSHPFFPLELKSFPAYKNIQFHEVSDGSSFKIGHLSVDAQALNHPQGALAYKIWDAPKLTSVVYATDHEHGSPLDEPLKAFIKQTDLFIFDSSYSHHTYPPCKGWGHSTSEVGAQFALEGGVKRFAIFHHEPTHTDTFLEEVILKEALNIFPHSFLAKEGLCVNLGANTPCTSS